MNQSRARFSLPTTLVYVLLGSAAGAPHLAQAQDAIGEARKYVMMELRRMSTDPQLSDSAQVLSSRLLTKMQNVSIEFTRTDDPNCVATIQGKKYKGRKGRFGYSTQGRMYICPGPFKSGNNFMELNRTLVHEATHLLGYIPETIPLSMDILYASHSYPYPPDLSQDALDHGINNAATAANFIRALNLKPAQTAGRPVDWRMNRNNPHQY